MKNILIAFTLIFSISISSCANNKVNLDKGTDKTAQVDNSIWTSLLQKYVREDGFVDYKGMIAEKDQLDKYLQILSNTNPNKLSESERFVFWINAYNAFTVDLIVRNYPLESIKDLGGSIYMVNQTWDQDLRYTIHGKAYTLGNIERKELFKKLFDPRIHFVINCASYSCPVLLNEAFEVSKIEKQLEAQSIAFVNDPMRNKISSDKAEISKLFSWYGRHFTKEMSLVEYINQYSKVKLNEDADIDFLDYNWSLNDASSK